KLPPCRENHPPLPRQNIARLADRSDHVDGNGAASPPANRSQLMVRVIKRGPDEIVHAGVDDDESLGRRFFPIENAGEQDAGIPGDDSTWLEDQPGAGAAHRIPHRCGVLYRAGRSLVRVPDPQSSADVNELEAKAG